MPGRVNNNETYLYLLEVNMSTSEEGPNINQHYHIFRTVETYFVPFICSFGLVCNVLAVLTFLRKDLRRHSCCIFLITRSITDSVFLFNLAIIYVSLTFDYTINKTAIVCQLLNFLAYVSAFISVYSVILVTCENYIRIIHPFQTKQLCTQRNAIICILIVLIVALCVYHVSLWVSNDNCSPSSEFVGITQAFVITDTVLTLVIPTLLLTYLIIAIIIKLIHTRDRHDQAATHTISTRLVTHPEITKSKAKLAAVTKMLLAVSSTFLILSVPSHIVRIRILIGAFMRGETITSNKDAAVQGFAQLTYYTSMSVNLFIYLTFGKNFRRVFLLVFFKGRMVNTCDREIRHVTPFNQNTRQYDEDITEMNCIQN